MSGPASDPYTNRSTADEREVRERLASLREAGRALRRRPGEEVIEALAAVLERWRDPEGPERRALARELPALAGFSVPVVEEGLARALAPWTGEALRAIARRDLTRGSALARGSDTTAVLLAGAIPMPSLLGTLEPLALRSAVLVKTAGRDPLTARLVKESVAAVDADLARALEVVAFPGADEACTRALLEADCIVATGSDATVDAVAARVLPPRRLLRHGHKLSVAVLGAEATRGDALREAAAGLALDVTLWDQLGCLSPVAVYAVGAPRAAQEVGEALAEALAALEPRLPRGDVSPEAAVRTAQERDGAELRAAAGSEVTVHADPAGAWCVVVEADVAPRPMPLHRFLRVHPVASPTVLGEALAPWARHLAGVAVAGLEEAVTRRATSGADAGLRLCAPGALQCPPLDWPRDGRQAFASLALPPGTPTAYRSMA